MLASKGWCFGVQNVCTLQHYKAYGNLCVLLGIGDGEKGIYKLSKIVKRKTRILIMQGAKDENERVSTEEEAVNISWGYILMI